jgi:hypothetical protein
MTNLYAFRGDDILWEFTIRDADEQVLDITDCDFRFMAKSWPTHADVDAVLVATTDDGGCTITDAPGGVMQVRFAAVDTDALELGALTWDLQITDNALRVWTVGYGTLRIKGDISRTVP